VSKARKKSARIDIGFNRASRALIRAFYAFRRTFILHVVHYDVGDKGRSDTNHKYDKVQQFKTGFFRRDTKFKAYALTMRANIIMSYTIYMFGIYMSRVSLVGQASNKSLISGKFCPLGTVFSLRQYKSFLY
jgi:hypothetical protein